jgi:oligopeptide transport system substrate-binding protein
MVLERNPNFHGETYPCEARPATRRRAAGRLRQAAAVHRQGGLFAREGEHSLLEQVPAGLLRRLGISSDSFDQAVRLGVGGDVQLTDEMRDKGIRLLTSVRASIFYMGFNMLDPVVGGLGERRRKLRQALSIAIDQEEFISIFMNGRGIAATSPLPPGIFGYLEGEAGNQPGGLRLGRRTGRGASRSTVAKKLLAEAGWPNGRHARPASRWCSTSTPPAAAWATSRGSTG